MARVAGSIGVALFLAVQALPSLGQSAAGVAPSFAASAGASGVSALLYLPGAPGLAEVVDLGFPGTTVLLDTIGTSTATAAFPDPGELVGSLSGLAAGLIGLGAYGLPPIELPTLPAYPFAVSTDAITRPDATLGEGVYELEAHSRPTSGTATASGGLRTGSAGNAALLHSTSSVEVQSSGTVVATGTGGIDGLTIGPLSIGQIRSTARMTMTPSGEVTPFSEIVIRGLGVGGVGIDIATDALTVGDAPVPLPIGETANALLQPFGMTLALRPSATTGDQTTAPAIVITMPVEAQGLSSGPGTFSLTLGGAIASIRGAPANQPAPSVPDAIPPTDVDSSIPSFGSTPLPFSTPVAPVGTSPVLGVAPRPIAATPVIPVEPWSVQTLYLTLGIGGCLAHALIHVLRLLGAGAR